MQVKRMESERKVIIPAILISANGKRRTIWKYGNTSINHAITSIDKSNIKLNDNSP